MELKTGQRLLNARKEFIQYAFLVSRFSLCQKRKVGAVVTQSLSGKETTLSYGFNKMPFAARNQCCEDESGKTKPEVIHAEQAAISELKVPDNLRFKTLHLYVTKVPCVRCAKLILKTDISKVFYLGSPLGKKSGIHLLVDVEAYQIDMDGNLI